MRVLPLLFSPPRHQDTKKTLFTTKTRGLHEEDVLAAGWIDERSQGMSRSAIALAVALVGSSCASQMPKVALDRVCEWKPHEHFKARIKFEWGEDSYVFRLDMTRSMFPCVGCREDGTLDIDAVLTLEDGTEVKGKSTRVVPELGDWGTFRSIVDVAFPCASSHAGPAFLTLRIQQDQETFRVVRDVY